MLQIGEITRGKEIGKQPYAKYIWQACCDCNKERWVPLYYGKPKYFRCYICSQRTPEQRQGKRDRKLGAKCHYWKGGIRKQQDGYIRVKLLPDDFFLPMADCQRYVAQHRLVIAKHLGRWLHPWEIVHHKNGIRDDNRIVNLYLVMRDSHDTKTKEQKRIKLLEARIKELEEAMNS